MKWLRYFIVVLSFILFSPIVSAGTDPVGWSVSGSIPANTTTNLLYGPVTYTFRNNLPYQLKCPLYIVPSISGNGFFNYTDNCSGRALLPGEMCSVSFSFQPLVPGKSSIALSIQYGRNVVPLPAISTTTTVAPPPLVTGTVTLPLPANIGAGEQHDFVFTYKNNNNGTVTGVVSPPPTLTQNAGGGSIINIVNGCAALPGNVLLPGQSCTVSGTLQAGVAGAYTVSHTLSYDFGLSTSLSTSTTATQNITGSIDINFPNPMGAGEQDILRFRFTNNGSGTVFGVTGASLDAFDAGTGGSAAEVPLSDTCAALPGGMLAAGASCTVDIQFNSGLPSPPSYFATVSFTYAGGSNVAPTTAGPTNGTVLITNQVTQDFPGTCPTAIGAGEDHDIIFTFTNTGSGTAYGITTPVANFMPSGGTCVATSTTCNPPSPSTLASGANCTATCTFRATTTGNASVTDSFTYAGGTQVVPQTSCTVPVTNNVVGSVPDPLPAKMGVNSTLSPTSESITFRFTNTGTTAVNGTPNISVTEAVKRDQPPTNPVTTDATFVVGTDTCTGTTLAASAFCEVTGTFTGNRTGAYLVEATFHYAGPDVTVSTNTNVGRTITINNRCTENVWYSFNGDPTQNGCASTADCPSGSVCNPLANGATGVCYWENPLPQSGGFQLGPMIGTTPTSSTVIIPDKGSTLGVLWSGKVAARTGCVGTNACDTADCNSSGGNNVCPAGNPFNSPSTKAEIRIIKATSGDVYDVQVSNGINHTLSVGPTSTPWGGAGNPYFCATPGSPDPTKVYSACLWTFVPPSGSTGDGNPFDFIWVKKPVGAETACTNNLACLNPGEVCGLRYDATSSPKFARVCGVQQGYWTANQACILNPADANTFFGCNDPAVPATPFGALVRNLYSCSPVNGTDLRSCYITPATTSCCGCVDWDSVNPGVPPTGAPTQMCGATNTAWNNLVQPSLEWLKLACPSTFVYPDDTASSVNSCNTGDTIGATTNVTAYTVTFCPEVISNPFAKKKVKAKA